MPQCCILEPALSNLAMACVAQQLENDSTARFSIEADVLTVWPEAADYTSTEYIITELQDAAHHLT